MAGHAAAPQGDGLEGLFEASPDRGIHTSAAAETGFLLGLAALLAAPFSIMHAVALAGGGVAMLCSFFGVVTTSRENVAGKALVPLGLVCGFAAVVLVGVRYLGLDTAYGDGLLPALGDALERLNERFGPR